jgi:hypothetical protein
MRSVQISSPLKEKLFYAYEGRGERLYRFIIFLNIMSFCSIIELKDKSTLTIEYWKLEPERLPILVAGKALKIPIRLWLRIERI